MRDALAERLLAKVMDWSPADVARERPILQALALLKYDEYQQFSPGMRFVESLARWLEQFKPPERSIAYDYVRDHLVFLSEAEMAHFASVLYPDYLKSSLLTRAAEKDGFSTFHVTRVAKSATFRSLQGSSLFFGLSDGARIDQFRRSNRELSHEQIFPSYELPEERLTELRQWLETRENPALPVPAVFLIDDFAGSGTSYIRSDNGALKGKIVKFLKRVTTNDEWKAIVKFPDSAIVIALYVATAQALANIETARAQLQAEFGVSLEVAVVQELDTRLRVTSQTPHAFVQLIENYYDASVEDEHTKKGGDNLKYGFASCGLPLVLHHNTPNNSLYLLWVEDSKIVRPLFQRFSRHRREG